MVRWRVVISGEHGATSAVAYSPGDHLRQSGATTNFHDPGGEWSGGALPEPRRPADQAAERAMGRPAAPGRPGGDLSDDELLRRHVAGDSDAFGQLFLRHRDRLWAVAVRTLSDSDEAADALQDAMISAFRRADSFRGDSAVTTWLHRIVVNACLDRMRRRSVRSEVPGGDERLLDALGAGHAAPDPAAGSDVSMEVLAALRRLPRDQRIALVLVDMLGYPIAEAAGILGVAPGTVKSRCARGRARLLPRLEHLRGSGGTSGSSSDGRIRPRNTGNSPETTLADQSQRNRSASGSVQPGQDGGERPR
ncbi:MAG: RNA polymerase sigma factor SigM [Streptosporangiaceae bacterium]